MKILRNANARNLEDAVAIAQEARSNGQIIAFSGGGTDLLQQLKDAVVQPDVLVNLRTVEGVNEVSPTRNGVAIGGLIKLTDLSNDAQVLSQYPVLAQAAASVGTPQIRNVGTLAGNVMQRPWCWYYRNGFNCFKAGGDQCFSVTGENQLHAILGGGPSYIVHPSDVASALVALDATFEVIGPDGGRSLSAAEFFVLPNVNPAKENVLTDEEVLAGVRILGTSANTRSAYHKVMDREAWTHAVVSAAVVLEMDGDVCEQARIVMGGVAPVPWRVPQAERLLTGQRITAELARQVGQQAIAGAVPLAKNGYKVQLASTAVERTLIELAGSA